MSERPPTCPYRNYKASLAREASEVSFVVLRSEKRYGSEGSGAWMTWQRVSILRPSGGFPSLLSKPVVYTTGLFPLALRAEAGVGFYQTVSTFPSANDPAVVDRLGSSEIATRWPRRALPRRRAHPLHPHCDRVNSSLVAKIFSGEGASAAPPEDAKRNVRRSRI